MSRWRIENYWTIRALRDNTTRLLYRHRVRDWRQPFITESEWRLLDGNR